MYKLNKDGGVIRSLDSASIPKDENNVDWVEYQKWVDEGNTPDPAQTPQETRTARSYRIFGALPGLKTAVKYATRPAEEPESG